MTAFVYVLIALGLVLRLAGIGGLPARCAPKGDVDCRSVGWPTQEERFEELRAMMKDHSRE